MVAYIVKIMPLNYTYKMANFKTHFITILKINNIQKNLHFVLYMGELYGMWFISQKSCFKNCLVILVWHYFWILYFNPLIHLFVLQYHTILFSIVV